MKYVDQNGIKHLIEKIRAEINQLKEQSSENTKLPLNISWSEVQQIVQSGKAEETFSLGDVLVCGHSDYGEIQWEIVGFNRETAENGAPYTMTLQSKNVLPVHCFDQREGFYYSQSGLASGSQPYMTYTNDYQYSYRQINPTEPIEGEVLLVLVQGDEQNGTVDTVYAYRPNQTTPMTVLPSEPHDWESGPELVPQRTTDYCEGNNQWRQSSLCKYLNDTTWVAASEFDLPYKDVFRGFSYGFDADFLSALGKFRIGEPDMTWGNTEWSYNLFTLPSLGNVCAGTSYNEDTVNYEKYQGETEELCAQKRVKFRNGENVPYLLRSPVQNTCNKIYYVASNGTIQSTLAYTEMGFAPICCVM